MAGVGWVLVLLTTMVDWALVAVVAWEGVSDITEDVEATGLAVMGKKVLELFAGTGVRSTTEDDEILTSTEEDVWVSLCMLSTEDEVGMTTVTGKDAVLDWT